MSAQMKKLVACCLIPTLQREHREDGIDKHRESKKYCLLLNGRSLVKTIILECQNNIFKSKLSPSSELFKKDDIYLKNLIETNEEKYTHNISVRHLIALGQTEDRAIKQ